ncbi:MAG: flagellar motor protein MotB [Rickettsiales bacterium]|nr:flagellar motor protein MotB [Rickettsiales bacterium]
MADQPPIIIKRIKKISGGHHGGAWKVAYADFVTAMMAFFLLLWLLSVTTPEQKLGIAEFFTPTTGLKDEKGIGFQGGIKASPQGKARSDLTEKGIVVGQVKQGPVADVPNQDVEHPNPDAESTSKSDKEQEFTDTGEEFKDAQQDIKQALEEDPELKDYRNNVLIRETPEGLKIDMIDDPKTPMFYPGGAMLTDTGKKVLDAMANIISKTPNNISITGHTDASGATGNPQYTNWELSSDRANTSRRFLSSTQLEQERVMKIMGLADRELLTPQEPSSPRNRRITIVLMRGSYFRDPKAAPTARTLLSAPDVKVKKKEPPKEATPAPQEAPAE